MSENRKLILIVDESEIARLLHDLYFSEFGFIVTTSGNGADALEILRACSPDIVLISLSLPGAVDAWETIRRMTSNPELKRPRVIAMDGKVPLEELDRLDRIARAFAVGADTFVSKPCMPDNLLARVRELLSGSKAA